MNCGERCDFNGFPLPRCCEVAENVEAEMAEMVPVPVAVSVTKQGIAVGDIVALVEDYVTGTGTDAWQCPELVRGMAAHTRTDAHAHIPCNGTCQHTASAHGTGVRDS